tara:strand:- start:1856 stop:2170 length:315 start_codon:yes stop_codon:yes gene_type:complete
MTKFLKRGIIFAVDSWRLVMDARFNPLRFIPDPVLQTYFMLVLFVMWSAFFGMVAMFYIGWFGYSIPTSIIVHLSILVPIAITNGVFIDAERDGSKWLRDWRKK